MRQCSRNLRLSTYDRIGAKDCHGPREALDNLAGLFAFVKLRLPRLEQAAQVVHPLCGLCDKTFALAVMQCFFIRMEQGCLSLMLHNLVGAVARGFGTCFRNKLLLTVRAVTGGAKHSCDSGWRFAS